MIEATELAVWAAQVSRLILRYMTTYGIPTTRDQRWAMARHLYPTVTQMRAEAYGRVSAQLRAEGLRPAPAPQYRPSALVAAIERATNAEPYVRPGREREGERPEQREREEPQRQAAEAESQAEPERDRPVESRARVQVSAPAQEPRSRVRVQVAVNDLDPQTRRAVRNRVTITDDNRREPAVVRTVTERVTATVERHIRAADRETIVATANAATEEIGWARVLSGDENCAFCAMLASRGPVYRSDKAALSVVGDRRGRTRGSRELGESYHDNCDCDAVLVRAGQDWAGREEFERLERLWVAATAVNGADARRTFNRAWRRIQSHPELETEIDQIWDESTEGLSGAEALRAFARAVEEKTPAALEAARRPRRAPDDRADSDAA
ncbi:hypothetical protein ATM97_27780 [Nocardia sp. MH4]|uniref:VG15 protein n=1 Tax=Nocardia sp. MH4 TaxID=1768677 RepID=UPI001C4EF8D6|nr:hypothetical protein [Nocardia sp. MH4]MBW0275005.1 hypothetical protein [Nocardia sp. MH4]